MCRTGKRFGSHVFPPHHTPILKAPLRGESRYFTVNSCGSMKAADEGLIQEKGSQNWGLLEDLKNPVT
jgi:hypothetical protein